MLGILIFSRRLQEVVTYMYENSFTRAPFLKMFNHINLHVHFERDSLHAISKLQYVKFLGLGLAEPKLAPNF